jgi:hypothetical protein
MNRPYYVTYIPRTQQEGLFPLFLIYPPRAILYPRA